MSEPTVDQPLMMAILNNLVDDPRKRTRASLERASKIYAAVSALPDPRLTALEAEVARLKEALDDIQTWAREAGGNRYGDRARAVLTGAP